MIATLRRVARSLVILANSALGLIGLRLVRATDSGTFELSNDIAEAPLRVVGSEIEDALHAARRRFPDRQIALLVDPRQFETMGDTLNRIAGRSVQVINCAPDADPASVLPPLDQAAFVYACDLDGLGLPFVRHIVEGGGSFMAAPGYQMARYSHVNEIARQVSRSEYLRQKSEGFDKFDLGDGDFLNLMQVIEATRNLSGAYVEIGCYRGSSGAVALRYMQEAGIQRDCHFLDVFTGFDYEEAQTSADALWSGTHETEGPKVVLGRLQAAAGNTPGLTVAVHQSNIITDPLPNAVKSIAVANIDVDMFEAVLVALRRVAPLVVQGGVIVAEDAGHTPACIGARLALEDFLSEPDGHKFLPIYMESGQTFLVRTAD